MSELKEKPKQRENWARESDDGEGEKTEAKNPKKGGRKGAKKGAGRGADA